MSEAPHDVGAALAGIRERIAAACERSGRDAVEIRLLGACKRQPAARLRAAFDAGLRLFGENLVQEAEARRSLLPAAASWHLIGPLQSNKTTRAAALFDAVHSIDRLKIARRLDGAALAGSRRLVGFLEINLGEEASKHGFAPSELSAAAAELAELEGVRLEGLMAIPPWEGEPQRMRPWFRRLRELRDELFSRSPWSDRPGYLSMGMSGDYEIAIEEGATHVRIGTALFGPRAS